MYPADEIAAKMEPTKRRSADSADSGDMLRKFDERFHALKDLQQTSTQPPVEDLSNKQLGELNERLDSLLRPGPQREPAKNLHNLASGFDHQLGQRTSEPTAIYHRVPGIENKMKRRGSRGFARYLVAISIGVVATLTWQSYGEATKQIIATEAPELGWSPSAKQMIASWVQQLGWVGTPVPETRDAALAAQAAPQDVAPKAPAPFIDPEQAHQLALDLAALRQTVERLAAGQDLILEKISALPLPRPTAVPARKPTPTAPPSSRGPPPQLPPHP